MPRNWIRWLATGGALFAVVAALVMFLAPRPVSVEAGSVVRGAIDETVTDQGYARVREAYVVSAPVTGRVERIDLHVGDRVVGGQTVVARLRAASPNLLDPRARAQAQAAVNAASAAVATAQAQQDQLAAQSRRAATDLGRTRTLAERGFASRQALDSAEADARAADASVRAAAAQLAQRRSELVAARASLIGPEADGSSLVLVTAPASGYVTRVLQESERIVALGAPLVEVSDNAGLEAAIEFLSQDAVRIREGMAAEVFDWGGGRPIPAVVRRVEPQAFTKVSALGVEEQRVLVLLQLKGDPQSWRALGPGYRLWGRVFLRREPATLKAPLGALVRAEGGWAAFRIEKGRARLVKIEVGALAERDAEVRKGLSEGDRLVVFPSDKVADGARVKARN